MSSSLHDKIEVANAIENLQYINRWLNIDVNATLESDVFVQYLTTPLDSEYDSRLEKAFSTTIYELAKAKGYPSFIAKKVSSYCEQDIRLQKLAVLKAEEKITAKQYEEEKKKLKFVSIISKAATRVARLGVKAALSYGIHQIAGGAVIEVMKWSGEPVTMSVGWVAYGIMTAYDFLVPEQIKKNIKQTAIDAINSTWDLFKKGYSSLKEMGEEVVDNIKDAIETGIEFIEDVTNTVFDYIEDAYEKGKNVILTTLKVIFN